MLAIHLLFYICSFITIWFGAGLIISGVEKFSSQLKISSFAVSFFILGLLTSIPELSLGLNAIAIGDPEIFVGNLLGGVIVIFLLIIPVLAILGDGITLSRQLDKRNVLLSLLTIASPAFFLADKKISNIDGVFMILLYLFLLFFIQKKRGLIEAIENSGLHPKVNYVDSFMRIIVGVVIVYFTSQFLVDRTIYFSNVFQISPFIISLVALSIGTNIPEFSLAIRSVLSGKKEIALGDYIGSASVNTLLFGVLSIINSTQVNINGNFIITFFFILLAVILFYLFSRSRNDISRKEGLFLLGLYVSFLIIELLKV